MKKEKFEEVVLEIVLFQTADVITTSPVEDTDPDALPW